MAVGHEVGEDRPPSSAFGAAFDTAERLDPHLIQGLTVGFSLGC
jgi:hypothetical protein